MNKIFWCFAHEYFSFFGPLVKLHVPFESNVYYIGREDSSYTQNYMQLEYQLPFSQFRECLTNTRTGSNYSSAKNAKTLQTSIIPIVLEHCRSY